MTRSERIPANVVGIDDAPFDRRTRGLVGLVGAVFAGTRLDGVLSTRVRRDGADATRAIVRMVGESRFAEHVQAVLLQGVAVAGFNVIDIHGLHEALGMPVLVIARRRPDLDAIREALFRHVAGGRRKWRLVERAGAMEPVGPLWMQRAGISRDQAGALVERLAVHGHVPEPLRVAHLIAGGFVRGESRGRV